MRVDEGVEIAFALLDEAREHDPRALDDFQMTKVLQLLDEMYHLCQSRPCLVEDGSQVCKNGFPSQCLDGNGNYPTPSPITLP